MFRGGDATADYIRIAVSSRDQVSQRIAYVLAFGQQVFEGVGALLIGRESFFEQARGFPKLRELEEQGAVIRQFNPRLGVAELANGQDEDEQNDGPERTGDYVEKTQRRLAVAAAAVALHVPSQPVAGARRRPPVISARSQ